MRFRNVVSALSIAALGTLAVAQTAAPAKPQATRSAGVVSTHTQIAKKPLPPFKPQQPIRIQLENGMVIFLQQDTELPFIDGTMRIRGGGREAPPSKAGMMGIYSQTWRTGGTKTKTGDELDEFLEARAASVESGAGLDSTTLSFSSLKKDFDAVFAVYLSLLREPEFRQDKIDLAKRQTKTVISRRNDDISGIAQREAVKLAYGANSPYAQQAEYWTVDAVTREDLLAWHKKYVHPNNIILGIVGDFDPKEMEAKLRREFGSWPKGPAAEKVRAEFQDPKPGVYFIEKEDVNQSSINLVALGFKRDHPDYYAAQIMNEIFGAASASRLFVNIRTRKGLAYSVGGGIGANFDYPGVFRIAMGTKSEQTVDAINALYEEIDNLVKSPGSATEVAKAKDNILNSFIFNFDSKDKVLREKMGYEFHGYPLDTLDKFRAEIEKVTPADVARVVKNHVTKEKFAILVVGKSADFGKPLTTLGRVQPIDITIRQTPQQAEAGRDDGRATIESNPEGKALVAKVVQFAGGKEKLAAIKALQRSQAVLLKTPQGDLTIDSASTIVYPDRVHFSAVTPMGELVRVVAPGAAFMSAGGQSQNLPEAQKAEMLRDLKRDMLFVLQHADDPSYKFAAHAAEGGLVPLDVDGGGVTIRFFIDNSGRILKSRFKTIAQSGPVDREVEFSDFRSVDGVMIPFKQTAKDNGEVVAEVSVKEIKLNPAIDEKMFAKP